MEQSDEGAGTSSDRAAVGLVGAGRAGTVLAAALRASRRAVAGWAGPDPVSAATQERVMRLLPDVPRLPLARLVAVSDSILIAVPDAAIDGVVAELAELTATAAGPTFYWHLSGLTGTAALEPLRHHGVGVAALHPAMTFTGAAADLDRLVGLRWACTCAATDAGRARALVADLGGRSFDVAEGDRRTYHAALSHASNFLAVLQAQASDLLAGIGITDGPALLGPLVRSALDDALRPTPGWTGPVSRADAGTIRRHLQVVTEPDTRAAYVALTRATLHRMLADRRLDAAAVARVEAELDRVVEDWPMAEHPPAEHPRPGI